MGKVTNAEYNEERDSEIARGKDGIHRAYIGVKYRRQRPWDIPAI